MPWVEGKYTSNYFDCYFFKIVVQWKLVSRGEEAGYEFGFLGVKSKSVYRDVMEAKLEALLNAKRLLTKALSNIERGITEITDNYEFADDNKKALTKKKK